MSDFKITAPAPGVPTIKFSLLLAILMGAEVATALEGAMIYPTLVKLYGIYGDPAHVSWLITAYAISAAGSAVLFSRLGDMFGRARMLRLMLLCAAVGSTIAALGTSLNMIILGRALQGVSMAILPLAFGILREQAQDSAQLNFGVGLLGGTIALSTGLGFVLAGVIVDNMHWQHIFTLTAVAASIVLVAAQIFLPNRPGPAKGGRLDMVGVLFIVPISALLLGLNYGQSMGWTSPRTLGLFGGGLVALIVWGAYELRQKQPLVDLRLLANPTIAKVNLTIFLFAMAPMIYPQVIFPLLQQPTWTGVGLGLTATVAGLVKLPTNVSSSISAVIAGLVARKHSMRPAIVFAAVANSAAFLSLVFFHDSIIFVVAVCVLLVSPAGTILYSCAPGLIIEAAPSERTSEATGLSSVIRSIATGVGTQMLGMCMATSSITGADGTKLPDEAAFVFTFAVIAGFSMLSLVVALLLPRRSAQQRA